MITSLNCLASILLPSSQKFGNIIVVSLFWCDHLFVHLILPPTIAVVEKKDGAWKTRDLNRAKFIKDEEGRYWLQSKTSRKDGTWNIYANI